MRGTGRDRGVGGGLRRTRGTWGLGVGGEWVVGEKTRRW